MQIHNLQENNSLLNNFLAEIRDVDIQLDALRFRRNIERIGEVMALEISRSLQFTPKRVETPLGTKDTFILKDQPVICSVLRAGLPMHQGFLNYFDKAENAFISAFRQHAQNTSEFEIVTEYAATPSLEGKTLILVDPMLATGRSLVSVMPVLERFGKPKEIHIACIIAAPEGVSFVSKNLSSVQHLWIASQDDSLNEKDYIIPGLGDAGDLAFGPKL